MITIENLKKAFGGFMAVDGITLNVSPGEVLGFLGPNGAGKSTTMKMLTGFIKPSGGQICLFGFDILSDAIRAKELIGYLPEGAPAYGDMTPVQFLTFVADIRGMGVRKAQRINDVICRLELNNVANRPIDTLSKGYKRRVGIAQAILHDPKVLILDEPTDGLDPNQKHQVRELIRGLAKDKIVIVSTHILEEVTAVCTRAVIIANGRVLADATPSELENRSRYHHAVTVSLKDDDTDKTLKVLKSLTGVKEVEVSPDHSARYTLIPNSEQSSDLLAAVNKLVQENGWVVDEIFMERGRLDDVFRQLTTQNTRRGEIA
ncbi:ABC transporter ATP-binding protein [Sansalvadorimonas verongulae]|uniref:ABC transporter ATP-binding protein n=1 Tax=Sansalvadorimonas verongulae TaxID=2172824 RepID=UPI0012BC7836|nr:ABC transporter ATP-binding protein [Sansalvadorimonas verongulae]MTI12896.1 ABC transporter ATP-binding protein [Sansalvadorimonas verongulae]